MSKAKRILSLVLALCMIAVTCATSFAAGQVKDLGYKTYMCIGDSIATGYLIKEEGKPFDDISISDVHDGQVVDRAFPAILAKDLGISLSLENCKFPGRVTKNGTYTNNYGATTGGWKRPSQEYHFINYSREGYTTVDLRRLLDPEYEKSMSAELREGSDGRIHNFSFMREHGFDIMQADVIKDIKKADVITLTIGSNDLLMFMLQDVLDVLNMPGLAAGVNSLLEQFGLGAYAQAFTMVLSAAEFAGKLPLALLTLVTSQQKCNAQFYENWDAIIKIIHDANPNATLVVTNIYNATGNLKLTDASLLRIGALAAQSGETFNTYMEKTSPMRGYYEVADVRDVPLSEWPPLVTWGTMNNFYGAYMYCAHPQTAGHQYYADQIEKVLLSL